MPAERSIAPASSAAPEAAEVTFASLGVPAPMVEVLAADGITVPFPIQAATLTDALAGRDILGRARTGSGKTLGFSLPMLSRLAGGQTHGGQPRGLVLVPTRELAHQVQEVLRPLARAMNLRVTTIYGGVSYGPQINALQKRTDIVVATPGRLTDLITQGECDLAEVEVTVIDEADQMADLGFLPIVRRLLESTPQDGQRMLFSATLDSAIDVLARRFLTDPALHSVDENSSPAEIEHHVLTIAPADRVGIVTALAGGEKRSLVFTRTKHGAERLARQLTQAGIPAAELHGNLRQGARSRNLAAFASGLARVMVATDIAARGIHIDGIDLVVHADPPTEHKAYVHRSGRTARGGADGVVVTLQTKSQSRVGTPLINKAGMTPTEAGAGPGLARARAGTVSAAATGTSAAGRVAVPAGWTATGRARIHTTATRPSTVRAPPGTAAVSAATTGRPGSAATTGTAGLLVPTGSGRTARTVLTPTPATAGTAGRDGRAGTGATAPSGRVRARAPARVPVPTGSATTGPVTTSVTTGPVTTSVTTGPVTTSVPPAPAGLGAAAPLSAGSVPVAGQGGTAPRTTGGPVAAAAGRPGAAGGRATGPAAAASPGHSRPGRAGHSATTARPETTGLARAGKAGQPRAVVTVGTRAAGQGAHAGVPGIPVPGVRQATAVIPGGEDISDKSSLAAALPARPHFPRENAYPRHPMRYIVLSCCRTWCS